MVYLLLAAVGCAVGALSHTVVPRISLPSFLVMAFLTWRVWHGGRVSRTILIMISVVACAIAVLAVARLWDLAVMALVITGVAQVALLASPPVYGRTRRPAPVGVRARGWAWLARRPPAALLPWGLLAGLVATLACLGSMDWIPVAGCRPTASGACVGLAEGYPLRWLTTYQNSPVLAKGSLLKDCVQWALASTLVLYLAWHSLTAPADHSG